METEATVTLYRPVGPCELALIEESGSRAFPQRLSGQPIFYPVCSQEYAAMIAERWNVRESGRGFVTRFQVRAGFLRDYAVHDAGGRAYQEYWIPAEDLDKFNANIVGKIEVVAEFPSSQPPQRPTGGPVAGSSKAQDRDCGA